MGGGSSNVTRREAKGEAQQGATAYRSSNTFFTAWRAARRFSSEVNVSSFKAVLSFS